MKLVAYICCLFVLLLTSCEKSGDSKRVERLQDDTTEIVVAVFPSLDALPLMIANDRGILDSLGLAVKFCVYRSQMDCEKSLAEGNADVAMTDLFRVGWWQWQKKPVRFAFATKRDMGLVANKVLRISKVAQLDDRMIAATRFSLEDYYCDKVVEQITKRKGQILRPQINSVELRAKMLVSGQLDAAVLARLQVVKAGNAGYDALKIGRISTDGFAGYAFNMGSWHDMAKQKQMVKLQRAYDIVVKQLCAQATMPEISETTLKSLFLDKQTVVSIKPKNDFAKSGAPRDTNIVTVVERLKQWSAVGESFSADTLCIK